MCASIPGDDPFIGQTVGEKYRVKSVIGRGANGVVYRGTRLEDDLAVAIKTIAESGADQLKWVRRFRREAKVLARVDHPNSVRMYDFGHTQEGVVYLVMELLEGRELRDELDACVRLPLNDAVMIASQVFGALGDAHKKGVVHRDLKPSNIFLCRDPTGGLHARLIDYGLARDESEGALESLTGTGVIVGTPTYMPPEQIQGLKVGPPADLYAMGVILFEMITGEPPFKGRKPMDLLTAHLRLPVPSVAALRPDLSCSKELQSLIELLMKKDPGRRPRSAAGAATLVEALLRKASLAPEAADNTAVEMPAMGDDPQPQDTTSVSEQIPIMNLEVVHEVTTAGMKAVVEASARAPADDVTADLSPNPGHLAETGPLPLACRRWAIRHPCLRRQPRCRQQAHRRRHRRPNLHRRPSRPRPRAAADGHRGCPKRAMTRPRRNRAGQRPGPNRAFSWTSNLAWTRPMGPPTPTSPCTYRWSRVVRP